MSNNQKNESVSKGFFDSDFEEVKKVTPDGGEIIPFFRWDKTPTLEGIYKGVYHFDDKEDKNDSWDAFKFQLEDDSTVLIAQSYQVKKALENSEGYGFRITFLGRHDIGNGRSVNNFKIFKSKEKIFTKF